MIFIIILMIIVIWKVYKFTYYKSKKFNILKTDLNEYILNCNELNEHIDELKETYSNVKKTNYGRAQLNDKSKYNYKRTEQLKAIKSEYIYECSSTVCKNAEQQTFKYLCKYFNIKADE